MKSAPFIDWLSISQRHAVDSLPVVADARVTCTDVDVTREEWSTLKGKQVEGSFSTSIRLRCDGTTIELSGNPGRFGRPDNVFNGDLDSVLSVANRILAMHNLPPFTAGEEMIVMNPSDYDHALGLWTAWTGATISNIHLTQNIATGSPGNARRVIDWLDSQTLAHITKGRVAPSSVQFGSKGGRKLLKFYIKADEMLAHAKNAREREFLKAGDVYQFANSQGLVRAELEMHRLMLRDSGLRYLGNMTMTKLARIFEQETAILDRVKIDALNFDLMTLPASVRLTAACYFRGENLHDLLPKSTWYRHAQILRGYGIDIAAKLNVTALPVKFKYEEITLTPIAAPDWYWPGQPDPFALKLVK